MHKRNKTATFDIAQIFLDNLVILFCYCVAGVVYQRIMENLLLYGHLWMYVAFSLIFTLNMLIMQMYDVTTFYYWDRIIKRTLASVLMAVMCISLIVFLMQLDQTSRLLFVLFCTMSCMMLLAERLVVRYFNMKRIGSDFTHILFVGDEDTRSRYMNFINMTSMKLKLDKHISYDDPSVQSPEAFSQLLMELSVDEVQFVHTQGGNNEHDTIQSLLIMCERMGVTARIIMDKFDHSLSKCYVSSVGTYPVLTFHSVSHDKLQLFLKSIIDVTGAIIGLVMLSPIIIFTAIAVKLDSPGPVYFKQKRVGINGNIFHIIKFRSMHIDAEERKKELAAMNKIKDGMMFKIDNDPRITKVGRFIRKTSIDELPQLFNVLRRDMSLVGTRPPTIDEVEKYSPDHWRRISILPGITGMWQVNGRSQILNFDDVVRLDKKYIDEWSVLLDVKLLLQTVKVVFTTQGAC